MKHRTGEANNVERGFAQPRQTVHLNLLLA